MKTRYVWLMRGLTLIYGLCAILFFIFPEWVLGFLNHGSQWFPQWTEISVESDRYWIVLASSMMAMLTVIAAFSADFPEVEGYLVVHCVSKLFSTLGFAYLFLIWKPHFAYVASAIVDGLILLILGGFLAGFRMQRRA